MSAGEGGATGACAGCLRRSWLLGQLVVPLDYRARDRNRLMAALELDERQLLAALAGRRRRELEEAWEGWRADMFELPAGVETICCHSPRYPARLRADAAPRALLVEGGLRRFAALAEGAVVTVLGTKQASDYGAEIAGSLARELALSGVAVAAPLADGVATAALRSARTLGAGAIAVLADGPRCPGARAGSQQRAVAESGSVVSELPPGIRGRRFGELAAERTLAHLGDLVVVVEDRADTSAVATARALLDAHVPVAAVPGRATSPLAAGPNALVRSGAVLVRDGGDVLELLPAGGARETERGVDPRASLPAALAAVIQRVADGCDTAERLCAEGGNPDEILLALSELEVTGVLGRGSGGRYIVRATPRN